MKYHALCLAYRLACLFSGWRVVVHGRSPSGHLTRPIGTHAALSFRDALSWAACYGPDYLVTVHHRGRLRTQRAPVLTHAV